MSGRLPKRAFTLGFLSLAVSYVLMTHTYFGIIASGMLRWAGLYTAGSWV